MNNTQETERLAGRVNGLLDMIDIAGMTVGVLFAAIAIICLLVLGVAMLTTWVTGSDGAGDAVAGLAVVAFFVVNSIANARERARMKRIREGRPRL